MTFQCAAPVFITFSSGAVFFLTTFNIVIFHNKQTFPILIFRLY